MGLLRLGGRRVPGHRACSASAGGGPRAERPRAGGSRAGCGRAGERGDRRAPVRQRAHGRATPVEYLRETWRVGQGGAGRCGGPLLGAVAAVLTRALAPRRCVYAASGGGEIGW